MICWNRSLFLASFIISLPLGTVFGYFVVLLLVALDLPSKFRSIKRYFTPEFVLHHFSKQTSVISVKCVCPSHCSQLLTTATMSESVYKLLSSLPILDSPSTILLNGTKNFSKNFIFKFERLFRRFFSENQSFCLV